LNGDRTVVQVPQGYRVGQWRVTRALASGSWSSVYAAERDPDPGQPDTPLEAALKFVPTGTLTARQLSHLADMTDRELTLHRRITHPRLIRMFETHVIDDPANPRLDGSTVLVLELAADCAAARLDGVDGGLPEAPRLIAEICAGLAHLHTSGWVHGDLKPSNVLLMADNSVRLADFGLAAEMDGTHAYLPPGGTADYTPPERSGEDIQTKGIAVRQTTDVWALGVTACQLLTGRRPFPGVTSRARAAAAMAYAAGRADLELPADLSPQWRQFIADCLAPDHATRLRHTAAELQQRAAAAHRPARPWAGAARGIRRMSRRVAVGGAVIWIGVLGAGGAALAVIQPWTKDSRTPPVSAELYFRTEQVPAAYRDVIVEAGRSCPANKAVTPLLIAAMLKAESNFDANLSDPVHDEYGIARWTPRVLQFHLPPGQRSAEPKPPFAADVSIRAVGQYLCDLAVQLEAVPGDPAINIAAAYRTNGSKVRIASGVPAEPAVQDYIKRLKVNIEEMRPVGATPSGS
jgi:serine/threonine protein kinase